MGIAAVVVKGNKNSPGWKGVPTPEDAAVFDLACRGLLPGIIDSLVHTCADTIANFRIATDFTDYSCIVRSSASTRRSRL